MPSQPKDKTKYREKPFSDVVKDADPDFDVTPIPVYNFTGRTFKEKQNKPYDPPKQHSYNAEHKQYIYPRTKLGVIK